MGWTNEGATAPCVEELLTRFGRVAHRIQDADYVGAMRSLRYWDAGYDLNELPRDVRDKLQDHSLAARFCLTSGDNLGATTHVRNAIALASATVARNAPVTRRRSRQTSKSRNAADESTGLASGMFALRRLTVNSASS
jgi:hypothetical protein